MLNDTGQRTEYDTGAMRENAPGKGRFDLIPFQALMRLAKHYENGRHKYTERNWEQGMPIGRYYDAAFRHLIKYADGWNDEDHLAAVLWNVAAIMHHEAELPKFQDLPKRKDIDNPFIVEK